MLAFAHLARSSRLTGRITYGMRLIEISLYHHRQYGYDDALRTLEHEMLHLYLHTLGRPSGHNALYMELARALEIRVFHDNPYPRNTPSRHPHLYECPACKRMVFRRRLGRSVLACGVCCRDEAAAPGTSALSCSRSRPSSSADRFFFCGAALV